MNRRKVTSSLSFLAFFSVMIHTLSSCQSANPSKAIVTHDNSKTQAEFEVATVKPARADNHKPIGIYTYPGGKVVAGQATLKMLLQYALDVQTFQVKGGPAWTEDDLFEVVGLPAQNAPAHLLNPKFVNTAPSPEQREMLRALLIERFSLKYHETMQDGQVFNLIRIKPTTLLVPSVHRDGFPVLSIGGHGMGAMSGQDVTMSFVALRLSNYLGRPVNNATDLDGVYDFKVLPPSEDPSGQTTPDFHQEISESLQQLGLQIKAGKGKMKTIVIDSAQRPAAN